jgi:epoxyqueuosine reductase
MTTWTSDALKSAIREQATALGFDACRFASASDPWPAGARLREFVAEGRHGTMDWMADTLDRRAHPQAMWPAARSAIVLAMSYAPAGDPLQILARRERGAISVYAQGDDYHELIKPRLKALGRWLAQAAGCQLKVFVDTAPLMEKPLAQRAGLGWQGKHTNLVSREHGSWLLLGSVLTDLDLPADAPEGQHCGSCSACLDICPTQAFPAPYQIDARACISYLTIEHHGPIPHRYRTALGNRIYGCDDCLAVCPWNKFAQAGRDARLHARDELAAPPLDTLARLDDAQFRALFRKSPVKRVGRDRFVRNVLYAIGNSADPALIDAARERLGDPSPVVRGAAAWALSQLLDATDFAALARERLASEEDAEVRAELAAGMGKIVPA